MTNLALYRKYRPRTFKEVIGQEIVVKTLTGALAQDIVSHAYLFTGPRGTGKTTIARLLAKSVNCQNRKQGEFEPCNKCASCQEINENRSIDLVEIDAASNRGIDDIRQLREEVRFTPVKSKYKVFIIDECHQLTKFASDALLKTLEEPPAHAIFILATTEAKKMSSTIISRCQRFDFRLLKEEQIRNKLEFILKKEKVDYEPEALSMIIQEAQGALRNAESLLDECLTLALSKSKPKITVAQVQDLLGLVEGEAVRQLTKFILEKETSSSLSLLNQLIDQGSDPSEISQALSDYLRRILLFKIDPQFQDLTMTELTEEKKKKIIDFGKNYSLNDIQEVLNLLLNAQSKIERSYFPQLPLELAIIQFCEKID